MGVVAREPTPAFRSRSPFPSPAIGTLTSKQRAHLRTLAHPLKPLLHIGKEGVTVAAVRAARQALNTRELLKIRVLDGAPASVRESAHTLAEQIEQAEVVQVVGGTAVLYRPHPEQPEIRLPR